MPKIISVPMNNTEQSIQTSVVMQENETVIPDPVYQKEDFGYKGDIKANKKNVSNENSPLPKLSVKEENKKFSIDKKAIWIIITAIWLSGATLFAAVNIIKYNNTVQILNKSLFTADEKSIEVYKALCNKKKLKKVPSLYKSKIVKTPMVYGFIKTKVLLPDIDMKEEDIYGVLAHELVHIQRKDLYIKFTAMIANAVNWFNPLVYIAVRKLMNEMELSCDERVLKNAGKEERILYGVAMLEIVKKCKRSAPALTTGFNPGKKAVKQRFENILDTSNKKKGYCFAAIILCLSILSTALIGCETTEKNIPKTAEKEVTKKETKELNYEVIAEYKGEADDIQPFFDMMDNSMENLGVSILSNSEGNYLIDYNGIIKTELPKSEYSFTYCNICNMITDHINYVDPETFEIKQSNLGHGGGSGHYIYDTENKRIIRQEMGSYLFCDDVEFAVVSKGEFVDNTEMTVEGYTGGYEYMDDGFVFVKDDEYYRANGYFKEDFRFGIVCNGVLVSDYDYQGFINYDNYGICALKKEGKWGYYNQKGEMILDHLYSDCGLWSIGDFVEKIPYSSSGGFIALNKNGKWGYSDTKGNIIIDFVFEQARPVSAGKAWVKDSEGWKVIEIKNIKNEFFPANAVELLDAYFENMYEDMSNTKWRFEYLGEKDFYSMPCYSFKANVYEIYISTDGFDTDYVKEMLVSCDKVIYDNQMIDEFETVFESVNEEYETQ